MAKQSNLFNFFRGKNRQTFKNNNLSDSEVVSEVVNTLLASVEKQVSAEKENRKKKRTAANNVLDLVMTVEKVSLWKKEFTFWDTEDGKVRCV